MEIHFTDASPNLCAIELVVRGPAEGLICLQIWEIRTVFLAYFSL